jgi:hypothetical protein
MRNGRISAAALVAALAGSTVLTVGAAPAMADSGKALPIQSVGDLVVDGARQRVFVSDPTGGPPHTTERFSRPCPASPG